jgi:hypothetical protein
VGRRFGSYGGVRTPSIIKVELAFFLATTIGLSGGGCGDPMGSGGGGDDPCDRSGVVCTVAGTGMSVFDGDGMSALRTSFYFPLDVQFDAEGRALILDWNNIRIRRINATGEIETIMGTDFEGIPTNGALAKDTPLHHASDIEFDADMRLYVAGDHVPVVFRVDTDGRVFIVAGNDDYGYSGDGGLATEATASTPFGVAPDDRGGFYFSDVDTHTVRYVDADGMIEAVAGDGTRGHSGDGGPAVEAQLNGPSRMRLLEDGSLLICDTENDAVRRLDLDGTIHAYAGTGETGYTGDGGPAVAATLVRPYDAQIGPDGSIFIADTGNHVIRRIDEAGVISTVVGVGVSGFGGDGGPASGCLLNGPSSVTFDDEGAMWIADTFNHRVRRVADAMSLIESPSTELEGESRETVANKDWERIKIGSE